MTSVLLSPDISNQKLVDALKESGVRVWTWPTPAIDAPANDALLREAIENLFGYDWLIFKNVTALSHFMSSFLKDHRQDELDDLSLFAIGAETLAKASEFQIHMDLFVERFDNNKVCGELNAYVGAIELQRLNILVPNGGVGREKFEEQLESAGARVDSVPAYRTCSETDELAKLKALLAGGGIDCVMFSDASGLDEFASVFDTEDLTHALNGVAVICRDQLTARAANEFGLNQTLVPAEPSVQGVASLIKTLG